MEELFEETNQLFEEFMQAARELIDKIEESQALAEKAVEKVEQL